MSTVTKPVINLADDSYQNLSPASYVRDNFRESNSLLSISTNRDHVLVQDSQTLFDKRQAFVSTHQSTESNPNQISTNKVPLCLVKLVRSIVRSFYSREHSLIVDMLVRNTIMREDDLCERLRFERKQLRQYLHTLKLDQFIKSKIQLETDADSKTTKIIHYFIDYKLFVNVVKYRLDQMQRRLEAEQRQSTSRASFKCTSCHTTYTDLEVDRLMDFANPGKLICVYCRFEVVEEEDNVSRTDARALIAKFHHQVRDPIDLMLRECDEIHLSPAILEPEIRPLEPLTDEADGLSKNNNLVDDLQINNARNNDPYFGSTQSSIRIVLSGTSDKQAKTIKERPVWMADSTIDLDSSSVFGQTEYQTSTNDSITQTLAPGRVPTGFTNTSSTNATSSKHSSDGTNDPNHSGDIMQLLLIHERRQPYQSSAKNPNSGKTSNKPNVDTLESKHSDSKHDNESRSNQIFEVKIGDYMISYREITTGIVKNMTAEERADYIRVGKRMYTNMD